MQYEGNRYDGPEPCEEPDPDNTPSPQAPSPEPEKPPARSLWDHD